MNNLIIEVLRIMDENTFAVILIALLCYLIFSISLYFIYKKAYLNSDKAIIPFYNIVNLLELVKLPKWLVIIIFVPYVNFLGVVLGSILINYRLSILLELNEVKKIGLIICPILFFPIVACGNVKLGKIKDSELLIKPKEVVVVEEKEFVLDVPTYEVENVEISKKAIGASQFIDNKMYVSNKKELEQSDTSDDAKDLTFDYDSLYK